MKVQIDSTLLLLILVYTFFHEGFEVINALSYDYTSSAECLANPLKPQYGGGIIVNPELNDGLKGWSSFGEAKLQHRESHELVGNKFIAAHTRSQPYDSISQKLYLHKKKLYTFSAWIQVSSGNVPVTAVFKTTTGFKHAGSVIAESNCWSMLKGGLIVDESGPSQLFFEIKNTSVEIWVDSVSLQPFTQKQWKFHQQQSIEKAHKREVRIQAVDSNGHPIRNATISIKQQRPSFPFGCAMNDNILKSEAYQNWFTSRPFTVTTFENEMKWYGTESTQGHVDYSVSDAMMGFAKQHRLAVRGHNVLWDDPGQQPGWVNPLRGEQLARAASKRVDSVVSKYKGQLIAWDVVNENLHFDFFERGIGTSTASAMFYDQARKADETTTLFMNDYNTIEDSGDTASFPAKYIQKVREIQQFGGNRDLKMGIGVEGHFSGNAPNLPYMRASIDALAALGLPIWITEVDVKSNPKQAWYLEQILREARSHPHVNGIIIWAAWRPEGCYRMCLTDNSFRNLPTGDVVDKLLREWGWNSGWVTGATDDRGFFETSLFHGDYQVKVKVNVTHPKTKNNIHNYVVHTLNMATSTTNIINASQITPLLFTVSA